MTPLMQALMPMVSAHLFLVFLRIGAVFFFLPIYGAAVVPIRIRLGLALVTTLIVAPLVPANPALEQGAASFVAACGGEAIAGLLIGFAIRCVFWIVQLAGAMASQSISLSQILGNQIEQPTPAMAQITYVAALALAGMLNFHVLVIVALSQTYDLVALGQPIPHMVLEMLSVKAVARMFYLAFGLAGPFLVVAVLYNLCLGIVNKAMPQLMVAFVGAPAVTWMGIAMLYLSAPVILLVWKEHMLSLSLLYGGR